MKFTFIIFLIFSIPQAFSYEGSSFKETWQTVIETPYRSLPQKRVTLSSMLDWGVSRIQNAANRTLSDREDILGPFNKLVHPNGICLKGTWEINKDSKYTGYFKEGSQGLIIARASAALSETRRGQDRAFGLAGKIYPTRDENHPNLLKTANFFLIDDLGGTQAEYFTDVELTNQPDISLNSTSIGYASIAALVAKAFAFADKKPHLRQVYEISELGEKSSQKTITPYWMKIRASASTLKSEASDFRNELEESLIFGNGLSFDILVAKKAFSKSRADWKVLGEINFTESVVSQECDHRLHFHHPRFREDLTY